jgi:RNA polymerase sigma factor (sigma-70 family)
MEAARTTAPLGIKSGAPRLPARGGSRRLLKLASDEGLVQRVRGGSEQAFALLYERHHRSMLAFSRHMLGSREEAEDAVQQTFISAYRDIVSSDKEIKLRPWLYQIARNQCISALRKRPPQTELDDQQPSLAGLAEQVARRRELRELLADLARLPDDQREALVLAELHDNSHSDVAEILGCDREKVKSLVFQARKSLLKTREARELACDDVRAQLSVLRGAGLRRGTIGRHVRHCDDCRAFERDVKMQRRQLAVVMAVVPTAALKLGAGTAIAAAGGHSGSGMGVVGATGAGVAGAGGGGAGAGAAVATGSVSVGKVVLPAALVKAAATTAAVAALSAGGIVGGDRIASAVGSLAPGQSSSSPAKTQSRESGSQDGTSASSHARSRSQARRHRGGRRGGDVAGDARGRGDLEAGRHRAQGLVNKGEQGERAQSGGRPANAGAQRGEPAQGKRDQALDRRPAERPTTEPRAPDRTLPPQTEQHPAPAKPVLPERPLKAEAETPAP